MHAAFSEMEKRGPSRNSIRELLEYSFARLPWDARREPTASFSLPRRAKVGEKLTAPHEF